ncbi:MAG: hypothetical protein KDA85_17465, partial [Planctomycetaceae bacterium]|nr:hypothetical protein [Planctomycetaceae bacterium]
MASSGSTCPAESDLLRLLTGTPDAADQSLLEDHLSECESCRLLLERLTDLRWKTLLPDASDDDRAAVVEHPSDGITATTAIGADTPESLSSLGRAATLQRFSADSLPNVSIPGIELLAPIGRGGMATVYRGRQQQLNRIVAVKLITEAIDRPDRWLRFRREA